MTVSSPLNSDLPPLLRLAASTLVKKPPKPFRILSTSPPILATPATVPKVPEGWKELTASGSNEAGSTDKGLPFNYKELRCSQGNLSQPMDQDESASHEDTEDSKMSAGERSSEDSMERAGTSQSAEFSTCSIDQMENTTPDCVNFRLPLPASQALFDSYREDSLCHGRASKLKPEVLNLFSWSDVFPLDSLNLSGCRALTDRRLKNLLMAHRKNLRYLNVSGCENLSTAFVSMLPRTGAEPLLSSLDALIVGTTVQIFGSMFSDLFQDNTSLTEETIPPESEEMSDLGSVLTPLHDSLLVGGSNMEVDTLHWDEGESRDNTEDETGTPPLRSPGSHLPSTSSPLPPHSLQLTRICPNITLLVAHGFSLEEVEYFDTKIEEILYNILVPLKRLSYLDLSLWEGVGDCRFLLPHSEGLRTLVLYNVPDLYNATDTICQLHKLEHLDISQGIEETGTYPKPVTTLHNFITSLRHLRYLDISCTNLASPPGPGDWPFGKKLFAIKSDIVGLRALKKPLEFLGLVGCERASDFKDIPAIKVAGDNERNENQVITALEAYQGRLELLNRVLDDSYRVYKNMDVSLLHRQTEAMLLVLGAMRNYIGENKVQVAGSAALFYIIRNAEMTYGQKREMIRILLDGMEEHITEQIMIRNCCLTLCQLEVPADVQFDYIRTARLLLKAIETHHQDEMLQRIVVFLLNSMACHVDGEQKVMVGELKAIECILDRIRKKKEAGVCDEIMEVCWSFLWNITDETPVNCERFLNYDGLELFYSCYTAFVGRKKLYRNMMGLMRFPAKKELVRNIMGLMGNIAEVKELREKLMVQRYVKIFCDLLSNTDDGIEISYNSAGVLAHMASDGGSAWTVEDPSIEEMGRRLIDRADSWKLTQRRFINYRSFRPILRLLPCAHSPASQHWAVWALANLTTVDGQKYCEFIEREGGLPLLQDLVTFRSVCTDKVRELARLVLENVGKWKRGELEELVSPNDDASL